MRARERRAVGGGRGEWGELKGETRGGKKQGRKKYRTNGDKLRGKKDTLTTLMYILVTTLGSRLRLNI